MRYKELSDSQRKKKLSQAEIKAEAEAIAKSIRSIISPLVVRRSRLDLEDIPEYREDLKRQHIYPTIPEAPIELGYNLNEVKDLYLRTLDLISPSEEDKEKHKADPAFRYFKASRYKPTEYIVPDEKLRKELDKELNEKMGTGLYMLAGRQGVVSDFMRRLLVRRFESSVAAFQESLKMMIESFERIQAWIEKRDKVPVYKRGILPMWRTFMRPRTMI